MLVGSAPSALKYSYGTQNSVPLLCADPGGLVRLGCGRGTATSTVGREVWGIRRNGVPHEPGNQPIHLRDLSNLRSDYPPAQTVRAVGGRIERDQSNPYVQQPTVRTRCQVIVWSAPAGEEPVPPS